jgi:putative transposase
MGHRLIVDLAEQALAMALANRNPKAELLHHSDRGSQYAATADHAWHDQPHVKTGELLG